MALHDYQESTQLAQLAPDELEAIRRRLEAEYESNRQKAIGQEQAGRRRLSDLQATPGGQAFMQAEQEQRALNQAIQRNPKLQEQFLLEREKSRLRQQELQLRPKVATPFESQLQRDTAKDYANVVQSSAKMGDQLDLTKQAINQFRDYTQGQILGTGPIATLFGGTKYISSKTEALEATFKTINLKNMVATFEGFSRAIDTGPERRAWEATQPGIALDDPTNAQILVGGLSLAAKAQAEGEARRRYIESSPDKTLKGYVSPVIGKTSVLFTPGGDPVVIPKDQIDRAKAQGLMTDKDYGQQILGTKGAEAPAGAGWSADKERRYQELLRKRGGS